MTREEFELWQEMYRHFKAVAVAIERFLEAEREKQSKERSRAVRVRMEEEMKGRDR